MTNKQNRKSIFKTKLDEFQKLEWDIIEPLLISKETTLLDLEIRYGDILIIIRKKKNEKQNKKSEKKKINKNLQKWIKKLGDKKK